MKILSILLFIALSCQSQKLKKEDYSGGIHELAKKMYLSDYQVLDNPEKTFAICYYKNTNINENPRSQTKYFIYDYKQNKITHKGSYEKLKKILWVNNIEISFYSQSNVYSEVQMRTLNIKSKAESVKNIGSKRQ